jgi:hypothetical protein
MYKQDMPTEKEIENYFCWMVANAGGKTWKFISPANRGVPDRIAVLNGTVWFVEIKKPGGKLSELQKQFAKDAKLMKLNYACLWSKEDVDQWSAQQ